MKIPKSELFRATDAQLSAIGFRRYGNKGWMEQASRVNFSEEQVATFRQIGANRPRKKQRRARPEKDMPDLFSPQSPEEYANRLYEAEPDSFR